MGLKFQVRLGKFAKYVMIYFLSTNQSLRWVNKLHPIVFHQVQFSWSSTMTNKILFLSLTYLFIVQLENVI